METGPHRPAGEVLSAHTGWRSSPTGSQRSGIARGEEFGDDGLLALLRARRTLGAAELRDAVVQAVTAFSRGDFQDDVTLVIVAVTE